MLSVVCGGQAIRATRFCRWLWNRAAEAGAFILGKTFDARNKAFKDLKALYGVRSAVAHGGAVAVSREQCRDAWKIVKEIVLQFLVDSNLKVMKTVKDFYEWVAEQRFAVSA